MICVLFACPFSDNHMKQLIWKRTVAGSRLLTSRMCLQLVSWSSLSHLNWSTEPMARTFLLCCRASRKSGSTSLRISPRSRAAKTNPTRPCGSSGKRPFRNFVHPKGRPKRRFLLIAVVKGFNGCRNPAPPKNGRVLPLGVPLSFTANRLPTQRPPTLTLSFVCCSGALSHAASRRLWAQICSLETSNAGF